MSKHNHYVGGKVSRRPEPPPPSGTMEYAFLCPGCGYVKLATIKTGHTAYNQYCHVCQSVLSAMFYWSGYGTVRTLRMSLEFVVLEDDEVTT